MKSFLSIGWFILGIIQFVAIVNGFTNVLGGFFGVVAAFILAEIPLLGSAMGIMGATSNWGWSMLQAVLLFIGLPLVALLLSLISRRNIY